MNTKYGEFGSSQHVDLILLIIVCLSIFIVKTSFISRHDFLLGYDSANYADVAYNLAKGNGFTTDFILHFFKKYPEVTHPEDRRLSIHSAIIAFAFLFFGKSAFAAKLPNIVLGSLLLPLTTYFLAKVLSMKKWVCFLSAVSVMIIHNINTLTFNAMADLLWAQFFLMFVLFIVKGIDDSRWLYGAGISIGLCYLTKGPGILLFPIALLYYTSIKGIPSTIKNKHLIFGLLVGILVTMPFLVRNYKLFGRPFYSTISYDLGYGNLWEIDKLKWWEKTFKVYWHTDPPGYLAEMKKWSLPNLIKKPVKQLWLACNLLGKIFFFSLISIYVFWEKKKIRNLWLIILSFILIISVFFFFHNRYEIPFIPIILILMWGSFSALIERIETGKFYQSMEPKAISFQVKPVTAVVVLAFFAVIFFGDGKAFVHELDKKPFPFQAALIDIAKWSKQNLPKDSVVMTHAPALFTFYSDLRAVQIPYDNIDLMKEVIKHYRVTHAIPWTLRRDKFENLPKRVKYADNINIRLLDPSLLYSNLQQIIRENGQKPIYMNEEFSIYPLY